ncbi:MAG: hypothetical protein LBS72_09340 [Oscillospiraceae bacterium]|jgi:hypothetical protein|nr:hypothetical protein [Oscillospiraceae bacterium]
MPDFYTFADDAGRDTHSYVYDPKGFIETPANKKPPDAFNARRKARERRALLRRDGRRVRATFATEPSFPQNAASARASNKRMTAPQPTAFGAEQIPAAAWYETAPVTQASRSAASLPPRTAPQPRASGSREYVWRDASAPPPVFIEDRRRDKAARSDRSARKAAYDHVKKPRPTELARTAPIAAPLPEMFIPAPNIAPPVDKIVESNKTARHAKGVQIEENVRREDFIYKTIYKKEVINRKEAAVAADVADVADVAETIMPAVQSEASESYRYEAADDAEYIEQYEEESEEACLTWEEAAGARSAEPDEMGPHPAEAYQEPIAEVAEYAVAGDSREVDAEPATLYEPVYDPAEDAFVFGPVTLLEWVEDENASAAEVEAPLEYKEPVEAAPEHEEPTEVLPPPAVVAVYSISEGADWKASVSKAAASVRRANDKAACESGISEPGARRSRVTKKSRRRSQRPARAAKAPSPRVQPPPVPVVPVALPPQYTTGAVCGHGMLDGASGEAAVQREYPQIHPAVPAVPRIVLPKTAPSGLPPRMRVPPSGRV